VLLGHGPNKAFMAPVSCIATERNCNSSSADVTAIEHDYNDAFQLFSDSMAVVLDFFLYCRLNTIYVHCR